VLWISSLHAVNRLSQWERHSSLEIYSSNELCTFILPINSRQLTVFRWLPTITTNLAFQKLHSDGGHFSAYERPKELVEDVRKMLGKGSKAFGVVPGKNGVEKS
jgi:hypothetical protein